MAIAGPADERLPGRTGAGRGGIRRAGPTEAAALAAWVATCLAAGNLLLGAVSMYPGAPMDGGQLVHAIVRHAEPRPRHRRPADGRGGRRRRLAGDGRRAHRDRHHRSDRGPVDHAHRLVPGSRVPDGPLPGSADASDRGPRRRRRDPARRGGDRPDAHPRHAVRPAPAGRRPGCLPGAARHGAAGRHRCPGRAADPREPPHGAAGERPDAATGVRPLRTPGPGPVGRRGAHGAGTDGRPPRRRSGRALGAAGCRDPRIRGPAAPEPQRIPPAGAHRERTGARALLSLEEALTRMLADVAPLPAIEVPVRRHRRRGPRPGHPRPGTRCRPGTTPPWTATRCGALDVAGATAPGAGTPAGHRRGRGRP